MDYFNFAISELENCLQNFPPGQEDLVLRTNQLIEELKARIEDGGLPLFILEADENNEMILSYKEKINSIMDELIGALQVATKKVNKQLEELGLENLELEKEEEQFQNLPETDSTKMDWAIPWIDSGYVMYIKSEDTVQPEVD